MAKQTKVLLVTGDDDYMAATFEASEHTKEEMFQKALDHGGRYVIDVEGQEITFRAYIFKEVPEEFIRFVEGQKDYDASKHTNWYIV